MEYAAIDPDLNPSATASVETMVHLASAALDSTCLRCIFVLPASLSLYRTSYLLFIVIFQVAVAPSTLRPSTFALFNEASNIV